MLNFVISLKVIVFDAFNANATDETTSKQGREQTIKREKV
jgi:hypothetical protein